MSIDKYISPYVASQFPRLYREEGPAFIQFVKAYYEWMEQTGGVVYDAKRLPEYRDIDTTTEDFLVHFKNKYMIGLPEDALGDKRTLQKHIKEIYSSKGTAQGLELLFRLLYNESSDIYLPGDDILRPSDGVWNQPIYLEVSVNPYNVLLIGEKITGRESGATAIVEDFQVRYINKRQINVLFLSNLRGDFKTNELILSSVVEDPLKSATVIGSMTDILINESGFGFKVGDVLEVGGGAGLLGKAIVSSVSPRNGAVAFTIQHGGSGFPNNNVWAPNVITVTPIDMDNPGIGADFEIGEIANTEIITTAVDIIAPYANTQLNSPDYQFPTAVGVENINTPLNQALNVQNITVGTIKSLRAINPGAGYNGPVVVTVDCPVISGLMITDAVNGDYKGNNAIIDGKASAGNGAIDTVKIINSGIGYANGDIITLTNENVPFIAGGAVLLGKQGKGEGYWKDTRSFLNSDKYIQDSFYYQEYSYETRLSVAFSYYEDLLKKLWHPAGTQGFGKVVVTTEIDSESDAVEVDIIATRITEYMTQFATYVITNAMTGTQFMTSYATQYVTNRPTNTSRTTQADYLVNVPNQIINGAFTFNTDNWSARSGSTVTWDPSGKMRVQLANSSGSAVQAVPVTIGHTYQLDFEHSNAAIGSEAFVSISNVTAGANVLASNTFTGAANTGRLTFTANAATVYVILVSSGANSATLFDNVQLRDVPTLTQLTEYVTLFNRDTSVDGGSRLTVFNTTTAFISNFVTNYSTAYDSFATKLTSFITQALTGSVRSTNFLTTRATATAFVTTFNTVFATNFDTATNRTTSLITNRATATGYDTVFDTAYATNRATTTAFNTAYDTVFGTSRATTTAFDTSFATTYATNRATTTTFDTNRATNTVFDTSRGTNTTRGTSHNTTTSYLSAVQTSRVTETSRGTVFGTVFFTSYVTFYNTLYSAGKMTDTFLYYTQLGTGPGESAYPVYGQTTTVSSWWVQTSIGTGRDTARDTSRTTGFGTTTTFATNYNPSRLTATSYNTTFVTNTVYATNIDTTTTFATNRATATVFDTTGATIVATNRATTTAYDTNFATLRATNRTTDTAFATLVATNFATNRATATTFATDIITSFITNTVFDTTLATQRVTDRSTATTYDTVFNTGTTKLTDILTNRTTATTVPTPTSRATSRATDRATNRATSTSRTTVLFTNVATAVNRDTSRTTVFVAYPTSFVTTYLTGTNVATDYQTDKLTTRSTATTYDTEYPTERLTAVLTQTDVASGP